MVGAKEAELVAAGNSENASERGATRVPPALGAARLYPGNAKLDAMVQDHAFASVEDVALPVHVVTVSELGNEALGNSGQDHRRFIGATGFASDVADERERPVPSTRDPSGRPIQRVVK